MTWSYVEKKNLRDPHTHEELLALIQNKLYFDILGINSIKTKLRK